MCWFWSPAASKYIMAGRSETTLFDLVTFSNILDEYGNTIPFNYLTMYYSATGYNNWFLTSNKPGTTGTVSTITHQANAIYHYENTVTTSASLRYPTTYISSTPWQSLYANSPSASIFSPGLYQAIARTTNGVDYDIIDLSELLNDSVATTQRILVSWDGANFLAFYGSIVLYSPDGITWARTTHLLYTVNTGTYGGTSTTPSAISVANDRLMTSHYGFASSYVYIYNAEVTGMYLSGTTPSTMGSITTNFVWGGSGSENAYLYKRIK
jgi:hypothetical protein